MRKVYGYLETEAKVMEQDQESSSEDAMAAYAIKMWGRTIKDANMEAR